ncbi:MAG: SBBP repeat-containing protein, partial [Bacteroidota bacterium]
MLRYGIILILLYAALACQASGKESLSKSWSGFIENKGQIIDQNNKPNPKVLYLLNTPGMDVQLHHGGFSYDVYSVDYSTLNDQSSRPQPITQNLGTTLLYPLDRDSILKSQVPIFHFHRIDIDFVGYDRNCMITAEEPSSNYTNYYTTGTSVAGVTHVRSFGKVTYTGIYPGIDVEFLIDSTRGFKYNIIVHPGGDLAFIRMNIRGAESGVTPADILEMKTSQGTIEETIPASHFIGTVSNDKASVGFVSLGKDLFGFALLNSLPSGATLVIDPVPGRVWATYYGGLDWDNFEYGSCCIDNQGNVISSGNTMSTSNVATAGACQTTYGGNYDAFLVKFNSSGQPLWATYYGGTGQEEGSNCATDPSGNVFLCGGTQSLTNISTPGSHQPVYGGWEDGYLVKFDPNGLRLWGTYYGGIEDDKCSSVATDGSGNVFICGSAHSSTGISTPGSHQPNIGSTMGTNAFLARFDPQGVRIWGTYYGGNLIEGGYSCKADANSHVIMCGMSRSPNNISTPGAQQELPGGVNDGFLVLFNSDGQRQWGTYYGGSAQDELWYCTFSNDASIYVSGESASTNNISTPGCHQPALIGNPDAIVAKFNLSGVRQWGTYYGGPGFSISWGCAADDSANVFICGQTSAETMISTPGSFQPVYGGPNLDAFLVKFNPGGVRQWGTYYGGTITDCGSACVTIGDTIYLTGRAGPGLATPGSYQPNSAGVCDGILVKFVDCYVPDSADHITGMNPVCIPSTGVNYSIPSMPGATGYTWEVPAGATVMSGQNTTSVTVDFGTTAISGWLRVRGHNSCGTGEPNSLFVTTLPRPTPVITGFSTAIVGTTYTYTTEPGMTNYQWVVTGGGSVTGGGGTSENWVQVQWNVPGNQVVFVFYTAPNGCPAVDPGILDIWVTTSSLVIDFTAPDTVYTGGTVTITNLTQGASTYYWNFCSGNANTTPTGVNIGNPGGLLNIPTYITLVKQGNDCFSFISCQGVGVIRYFHGTSFANSPVSWTNLGTFGLINFNEEGIQVKYDNGNWYGFVNSFNTLIRLDFGNSLWNTPTALDLGPFPSFVMAHGLVITQEGTTWLGFITCSTGQKLLRLNFGTSLSNTPVVTDFGSLGGVLIQPFSICLVQENSLWYALVMASGTTLARITFGTSLLNTPTGVNLGNPGGFNSALGLTLLRDCGSTTGYWTNYLVNGQLGKLTFPSGITGTVTGTVLGNIGALARPSLFSEIFRQNDTLFAYICNRDNGTLSRLTFPPCTSASVPSSTLFTPPPFSYSQPGTYNIHLIANEGLPTMASLCKPVVVMDLPVLELGNDRSICPGNSTILDAGAGFTSYQWSTGASSRMITVQSAGTYSVTVTRWGCTASDAVNVTMFSAPTAALGPDQTICEGQSRTFDAGACAGCTYQWGNLTTGQPNVGTGQTYTTGTTGTYMVTVYGSNGCMGRDTVQLTVDPVIPVSVTISASGNPVCAGTMVTYTAAALVGTSTPSYTWKVNGLPVGGNSKDYTYMPQTGDCVICIVSSTAACVTGSPATSNQVCMTVDQLHPVSLTITSTSNHTCAGTPVTFNAFPTNPGSSPVYQWKINGTNSGSNSQIFTYTPANGDCITCELISDIVCPVGNPALSNTICMTVDQILPVSIIVSTPVNTVCEGTSVTFTANPTHGGTSPTYQWKVNTINVIGATNSTYTYTPLNGDVVTCQLNSSDNCVTGNPAISAPVTMTVNQIFGVIVSISASANPFCAGSSVSFTATPDHGGLVPAYQWKVNGGNAGTNNPTFTYSPANGDQVSCALNSSASCITGNPALSNIITMTVNTNLPAGVTISTPTNPFCPGTSVTITATPTNGGLTPVYQWKINGANAGTNLFTFTFNPVAGDSVRCVMTSNLNCVTGNPASSARIIMSERAAPNVTFTTCFDTVTILGAQPFSLHGGLPLGGQYSGPGVNTGI